MARLLSRDLFRSDGKLASVMSSWLRPGIWSSSNTQLRSSRDEEERLIWGVLGDEGWAVIRVEVDDVECTREGGKRDENESALRGRSVVPLQSSVGFH